MASSHPSGDGWPSLGVVVPVYNEAAGIEDGCRAILQTLSGCSARSVLIAVDDGSTDASQQILRRLADVHAGIEVVVHPENAGYGHALRTGTERAAELGLDYVAFMDSDLTNPPTDLFKILSLAREGHVYIKGSRFVPGGSMRAVPWRRRSVSWLGNLVAATLFGLGIRDVTNGFRAGRTDFLLEVPTRERGFAVIVEELAGAVRAGAVPVEFPTVLGSRTALQRGSAFSYSAGHIMSYLRYPLRVWSDRLRGTHRG